MLTCPPAILRAKILCRFVSNVELIMNKLMLIIMLMMIIMMVVMMIDGITGIDIKYHSVKVMAGYSSPKAANNCENKEDLAPPGEVQPCLPLSRLTTHRSTQ